MAPPRKVTKRVVDANTMDEEDNKQHSNSQQTPPPSPEKSLEENAEREVSQSMNLAQEEIGAKSLLIDQINLLKKLLKAPIANEARREQETKERESQLQGIIEA